MAKKVNIPENLIGKLNNEKRIMSKLDKFELRKITLVARDKIEIEKLDKETERKRLENIKYRHEIFQDAVKDYFKKEIKDAAEGGRESYNFGCLETTIRVIINCGYIGEDRKEYFQNFYWKSPKKYLVLAIMVVKQLAKESDIGVDIYREKLTHVQSGDFGRTSSVSYSSPLRVNFRW